MSILTTKREIARRIEDLKSQITFLQDLDTGCTACIHWEGGTCKRWGEAPPRGVFLVGCEEWKWDEVPF